MPGRSEARGQSQSSCGKCHIFFEAILVGMLWAHQEAQVSDVNFAKPQHYGLVVLSALCAALLAAVTALLCAQSRRKRNFRANNARVSSAELPDIVRSDGVRPHTGPDRQRLLRLPLTPPTPPKYYLPPKMPTVSFCPAPSPIYLPTTCAPEEL